MALHDFVVPSFKQTLQLHGSVQENKGTDYYTMCNEFPYSRHSQQEFEAFLTEVSAGVLLQHQVLNCQDSHGQVQVIGDPGVAVLLRFILHKGVGEGTCLLCQADHESQGLPLATLIQVLASGLAVVPRGMGAVGVY